MALHCYSTVVMSISIVDLYTTKQNTSLLSISTDQICDTL